MKPLLAIDLCCGAGGWAVAARGLPIQIELAIDWWDAACMTYSLNHPRTQVLRADMTRAPLDLDRMRARYDLVLGAIPCQWLSSYRNWSQQSAVKAEEIATGRALIDALLSLVEALAPRWWVLEDVTQLRRELPPLTPHLTLCSRHWSAQRRKRLYVGRFPRPAQGTDQRVLGDVLLPGPHRVGRRLFGRRPATSRTFARDVTLAALPDRKAPTMCALESRRDGDLGVVDSALPGGLRQLDWREAALLQGYPTDYLFYGGVTDVSLQIGNSVQIDTARAILGAIVRADGRGAA